MIATIFFVNTLLLGIAMVLSAPRAIRYYRAAGPRSRKVMLVWSALIVGQFDVFWHNDQFVTGLNTLTAGSYYQIAWMAVAAFLIALLLPSHRTPSSVWKPPLIAFVVYIGAAYISVGLAADRLMGFYRASQLVLDAMLLIVAYAEQARSKDPRLLLDVSIFWLVVVIFATVLGAVLLPGAAFSPNKGVLGVWLKGAIIHIHPDELGLMSALALLVSMVRLFGGGLIGGARFLWFAMVVASGCVLFFAQARTSIVSCMIALILAGLLLKQMRWMTYVFSLLGVGILIYYWLSGSGLGVEQDVVAYMRRGVSDEALATLSGRTGLWQVGWKMFADSPLFGHGFVVGVRNSGVNYGLAPGISMHNAHMEVLVDTGILGYIPWLIYLLGVAFYVWKNFRMCRRVPVERLFAVQAMLMAFVILFRSALGYVLISHQLNTLVFLSVYLYAALNLRLGLGSGTTSSESKGTAGPAESQNGASRLDDVRQYSRPMRGLRQ